jgi:hypothetical protein
MFHHDHAFVKTMSLPFVPSQRRSTEERLEKFPKQLLPLQLPSFEP